MNKQTIKEKVLRPILDAGFQAYFVGGCVRDMLLNRQINDFDIATSATPDDLHKIFTEFIDKNSEKYGVTIPIIDQEPIEIATFRKESTYSDERHPDEVVFTDSIKEDAMRRDFTINALYEDINGVIFDPTNEGLSDLENNVIGFIGNAEDRLKEDPLRALRFCRFISQLDFIHKDKFHIERDALNNISYERIGDELKKLFGGIRPVKGLLAMVFTGVLNTYAIDLFEIFNAMNHEAQRPDYHFGDVLVHTESTMEHLRAFNYDWTDMMAAFFHDVGKPIAGKRNGPYREGDKFNSHVGHEKDSAEFFEKWIKERPGLMSNKDFETIKSVILNHTKVGRLGEMKDAYKIYEIISDPYFYKTVKLEMADQRAHISVRDAINEVLKKPEMKKLLERVGEKRKINGDDLINAGLKPDHLFKKRLEVAFKTQIKNPEMTKEQLLQTALSIN